jgi:hypothetical protein
MNMKLKLISMRLKSKFTIQRKAAIAILSRNLTAEELSIFKGKLPKVTVFATDAIALSLIKKQ